MSEHVAVLNVGGILLVTVPANLDETAVIPLQEDLSARILETAAHGDVIDITAVEVIDTFVGRRLSVIASVANLLGARPLLVAMRPAVALTLAHLGVELDDVAKPAISTPAWQRSGPAARQGLRGGDLRMAAHTRSVHP
ncbi:STAS domain-containing protein [Streptomyces goshikiensis]|uniref:STAS domain-containing protein n=1 Tax=Streptomyces goshikiensis TaxID=1942 RepID=UPI00369A175D